MSGIIGGAGSKSGVIGTTELDYEEGIWEPSGTNLHADQDGYYTKVGRLVTCTCRMNGSTGQVPVPMSGLPFTQVADSSTYGNGGGVVTWHNDSAGETYTIQVNEDAVTFYLRYGTVNKNVESGKTYVACFQYFAA